MAIGIIAIIVIAILAWVLRPGEKTGSHRLTALAIIVPLLLLALAAIIVQLLHNSSGKTLVSDVSNTLFIAGLFMIGLAILISAFFAVKSRKDLAKGAGFGVCVAAIIYIFEFGLLEWLGGL